MMNKGRTRTQSILLIAQWAVICPMVVLSIGERLGVQKVITKGSLDNILAAPYAAFLIILFVSQYLSKQRAPQSMDREQAAAWEAIRVEGKRKYIRVELVRILGGLLFIAMLFLVVDLLAYLLGGVPYSTTEIIVFSLVLLIFAALVIKAAKERWRVNENRYDIQGAEDRN